MIPRDQYEYDYRVAISTCVVRYHEMLVTSGAQPDDELLVFAGEIAEKCKAGYPSRKLCRWIGYLQRGVVERGLTTVDAERDWTRPLFRPLDFKE